MSSGSNPINPNYDVDRTSSVKDQLDALLVGPSEGSFPFQVSVDDLKKTAMTVLTVMIAAGLDYVLQTVIPSIHTSNPYVLLALPALTAAVEFARRYFSDTRPVAEKLRLPYKMYCEKLKSLKLQQKSVASIK